MQEVGEESQLAAVLDLYPVYRGIWAVHQNEAFGDKVWLDLWIPDMCFFFLLRLETLKTLGRVYVRCTLRLR